MVVQSMLLNPRQIQGNHYVTINILEVAHCKKLYYMH